MAPLLFPLSGTPIFIKIKGTGGRSAATLARREARKVAARNLTWMNREMMIAVHEAALDAKHQANEHARQTETTWDLAFGNWDLAFGLTA